MQWNYVHTSENPSDLPTRGLRAEELAKCELWWHGPRFLRLPRHEWPEQPQIRSTEAAAAETRTVEEIAKNIILQGQGNPEEERPDSEVSRVRLIQRLIEQGHGVRKAMRLLERLAEIFCERFRNPRFNMIASKWERCWVKHEQKLAFPRLYNELSKHQRPSELIELRPCLDTRGILRVGMGLSQSLHHDWEISYPMLLHHKMKFQSKGHSSPRWGQPVGEEKGWLPPW